MTARVEAERARTTVDTASGLAKYCADMSCTPSTYSSNISSADIVTLRVGTIQAM